MTRKPLPDAPGDLSDISRSRWPGLAGDVVVTTGGAEVDFAALANVLRVEDRLAVVRTVLDAEGPTATGSRGQMRPHPLLSVELALVREIAAGYDRLGLGRAERWQYRVTGTGRLQREDEASK